MLTRRFMYALLVVFALLTAALACGPQSTPPSLPTATASPLRETGEPTQSMPIPTKSARAQPALGTPLSAEAVSEDGPWLVFASDDALWVAGADGTGAAQLDGGFGRATSPVVAPSGGYAAYVTARTTGYSGLELHVLSLPAGEIETITALTSAATAIDPRSNAEDLPGSPNLEIARAILDVPSLAWSPDGTKLAFIGAMKGSSADLYVYSLVNRSIEQLTDGPSQGYRPTWSPDGEVIVHAGADSFGTGAGYAMAGVWAARADGSAVKELYKPDSGDEVFAGWVSSSAFLVYSWGAGCGPFNLRIVDIETGETTRLWPGAFFTQGPQPGVAYDPATGSVLIALDEFTADAFCSSDGQPQKPGLYLASVRRPRPLYISDLSAFAHVWDSKSSRFFAGTEDGAVEISTMGAIRALPAPTSATPVVSPDGTLWAWANGGFGDKAAGLWVGPVGQKTPGLVFDDAVYYATWSPDSQRMFFFADDGLYVVERSGGRPLLVVGVRSASGDAQWVAP